MRCTTTTRTASSRCPSTSGPPSSRRPYACRASTAPSRSASTPLLHPTSIAVIGAGRRPSSIGHRFLRNIQDGGFVGPVYAVNPEALEVLGLPTYARVGEIPGPVDLAVVAVPAESVLDVVDECAQKGVRSLVVASAGFAESGEEGVERQEQLRRRARENGLRVIGPNSFGIVNTDPAVSLNASLSPRLPRAGGLGLFAQSGALSVAVLASADRRGLGLSDFASAGNRVDVSGNDLMQYWIDDDSTAAVGLYLESMGNPRKFSRIARALAQTKPVIAVSSGVSSYGAPPGHRVRQTRVPPGAFGAMLRQAGVIRVENVHQLFDVAQVVIHQPLPAGERVAVVSNSDALSALTAQAALSWDLQVTHGPVSLPSDATADRFSEALRAAFEDPEVDSVLTCFIPPLETVDEEVVAAVRDVSRASEKTCVATFLGMSGVNEALEVATPGSGQRRVVPVYGMPEDAVRALAAATRYSQWRTRDRGMPVDPVGIDRAAAATQVEELLEGSPEGRDPDPRRDPPAARRIRDQRVGGAARRLRGRRGGGGGPPRLPGHPQDDVAGAAAPARAQRGAGRPAQRRGGARGPGVHAGPARARSPRGPSSCSGWRRPGSAAC